jgi:malonyl-CoA/methylmalonyl-CoA synthetase
VADPLLPSLLDPKDGEAVRVAGRSLSYPELARASAAVASCVAGSERVAIWAEHELETAVAVAGALLAGVAAVPLNPKAGDRELHHIVTDAAPGNLLCAPGAELPAGLAFVPRVEVDVAASSRARLPDEPDPEVPALVVYTSGTTGPPKGVLLPRRAIASNLDALAQVWEWVAGDVLVHGLPLFHVHGLVLGILGPMRLGGRVVHVGRFAPEAIAAELSTGATMVFGVPTMYRRLADAMEQDSGVAAGLARARLLVSGSAALPAREHERVQRLCGQRIVERYGMSETLMNCSVRASGDRRPGFVGLPLPGVEIRLLDEDGVVEEAERIGEVHIRGPNLFLGYLNRPDATAEAMRDGWFATGDLAALAQDGYVRIVGRKSTDLIKTGGYKVGAGEVENALLEHPAVAEAAVTGEPDDDLGERIVAWIVPVTGSQPDGRELADHVAALLTPHKRPRAVRFVESLPRNELGKVQKARLST